VILILRNRISYKYSSKDNTNLEQTNTIMDFEPTITTDIYFGIYENSLDNESTNPN
jgi:hypothetical protein